MNKIELKRGLLRQVENPARYLGGEWNMVRKDDFDTEGSELIHFAFCFPDVYEVGMSNVALRIIYGLLNEQKDIYCERVFSPAKDMRAVMMEKKIPPFSLETHRPLKAFDIVGFTLQYELSYLTVLDMLAMANIPVWQKNRQESDPLVVGGGPCALNPEPIADFFDLFMIGEGEELILEFMDLYREYKNDSSGLTKAEFLLKASQIEGIYVPSLYREKYDSAGNFQGLEPINEIVPEKIRKRVVSDLDSTYAPVNVLVPNLEIVHDRVFLELYRGCGSGCRFCQAGMIYRPVRERSALTLREQAKAMLESSGYEEIGLLSLSTGDYSELEELCDALLSDYEEKNINLSLPSLRLDSVSMDLLDRASRTRKSGLTFAPEAGTQSARDRINKNILKSDLMETARLAFEKGWERIKLYFMLGLPGETDDDILGIADLCFSLIDLWNDVNRERKRNRKVQITVSTSIFIPKPWTPFQWEGQISLEEMERRQLLLANNMRHRMVVYQWHDFPSSQIETALARGDRRMSEVIFEVHKNGAWLEGERSEFSYERWTRAFEKAGLDLMKLVHEPIAENDVLPWEFIDTGVKKEFLLKEKHRSEEGSVSPGCREACLACGAASFATGVCLERGVVHEAE